MTDHVAEVASSPPSFGSGPLAESGLLDRVSDLRESSDFPGALARLVEGEILPRLMLAHRARPPRLRAVVPRVPSPGEIVRFSEILLAPGDDDVGTQVMALLDEGLPLESLLLDLLAPAARHLGTLWEEDACDFLDVTRGLARLQAITRLLCDRLEDDVATSGQRVLLAPCPGETHVYALSIVASFFREAGWDVTTAGSGLDLAGLVADEWFDVIGLSLACDVRLPDLIEAVRTLRAASRNRSVRVMIGGPFFARHPGERHRVGADACTTDGRTAPALAESLLDESLLELRARAC